MIPARPPVMSTCVHEGAAVVDVEGCDCTGVGVVVKGGAELAELVVLGVVAAVVVGGKVGAAPEPVSHHDAVVPS